MRHIKYCTFFLIVLFVPGSLAANLISPIGFPTGIAELTPAQASRTTGVAPLSVFFNADLAPSSPSERSFHDYEYSWDFGDPTSGNWGTTGASKNTDKGPVAAHVFETPGTYTVTLSVKNSIDGTDVSELAKSFVITVTDPDVVFTGTNTTCISDTTHKDFTGCPTGATQIATDNLSILSTYTGSGKRVLLQRGSSWTLSSTINFPKTTGPVSIGPYGECNSPDEYGICSNAPQITTDGIGYFLELNYKRDWRIFDITFSSAKTNQCVFQGLADIRNILILRLDITGFNTPIGWVNYRANDDETIMDMSVVSCRVRDFASYGLFVLAEKLSVLGNEIKNSDTTHVTRVLWAFKSVYSHNLVSGSTLTNTNGRQALKMHGPAYWPDPDGDDGKFYVGDYATTGPDGLPDFTRFVVISDNVFGSSGPWPVSIGPQDSTRDERVSDLIFEKNKILAQYGISSTTLVQVPFHFSGRYATIRNNIIDATGGSKGIVGIEIIRQGSEWTPLSNSIYNNTIYRRPDGDPTGNAHYGFRINEDASDTIIRNNYISFPDIEATPQLIIDYSGNAVVSNNVVTDTPYFVDPDNTDPIKRNFSLTSESIEAIDKGYVVPVNDDFSGEPRTGIFDIGADSY